MDIRELVARRSDLSTFLVHRTRDTTQVAGAALKSILTSGQIEARSMFGHARRRLNDGGWSPMSQRCVCFTETPLEYTHLLLADVDGRSVHLKPYGIAITKRIGRQLGVNPVWYLDITPGHDWLASNVDGLLDRSLTDGQFTDSDVERLAPYIEHMGTCYDEAGRQKYRKSSGGSGNGGTAEGISLCRRTISACARRSTSMGSRTLPPSSAGPLVLSIRGGVWREL